MKPKSRARLSEADGYYLPGLFGENDNSTPLTLGDSGDAFVAKSGGYWVRRSAKQRADEFGQPAGYRYELMLGGLVVESGTGGNFRRSFLASATFLNSKQPRPHPCRQPFTTSLPAWSRGSGEWRALPLARLTARR